MHFRDKPQGFNETQAFTSKSTWYSVKGHAYLEGFWSQVENIFFEIPFSDLKYSNMSRNDSLLESEKQSSDTKGCRDVINTENILSKLSEASNKMFISLQRRGFLIEKQIR